MSERNMAYKKKFIIKCTMKLNGGCIPVSSLVGYKATKCEIHRCPKSGNYVVETNLPNTGYDNILLKYRLYFNVNWINIWYYIMWTLKLTPSSESLFHDSMQFLRLK